MRGRREPRALENAFEDQADREAPRTPEEARQILQRWMTIYRTCRIRGLNCAGVVRDALRGKGYPTFGAPSTGPVR